MSEYTFNLPDIGEGLSQGEIVRWLVEVEGSVRADQPIVEVETDKALVEIPAPITGKLKAIGGVAGDIIPIGNLLAIIEVDGAKEIDKALNSDVGGRTLASPATRKLAIELGIDITTVQGTGPKGRITKEDVNKANNNNISPNKKAFSNTFNSTLGEDKVMVPKRAIPLEQSHEIKPLKGLRKSIAEAMTASLQIPTIIDWNKCDATHLIAARDSLKDDFRTEGVKLTYLPFFIKACVLALKKIPSMNATIDMSKGEITYYYSYNIGIATSTGSGLVVPVIRDADAKPIIELAKEIGELSELAHSRKIRPEQLTGSTFTITNFGSYGSRVGTPIIRPPEVAIGGFGSIQDDVISHNKKPVVRPVLPFCAATDHRINDGEHLWAFLKMVGELMEKPTRLLGYI